LFPRTFPSLVPTQSVGTRERGKRRFWRRGTERA
jgi:hypothetical protein